MLTRDGSVNCGCYFVYNVTLLYIQLIFYSSPLKRFCWVLFLNILNFFKIFFLQIVSPPPKRVCVCVCVRAYKGKRTKKKKKKIDMQLIYIINQQWYLNVTSPHSKWCTWTGNLECIENDQQPSLAKKPTNHDFYNVFFVRMCVCVHIYIYIYIYMHACIHTHTQATYNGVYI